MAPEAAPDEPSRGGGRRGACAALAALGEGAAALLLLLVVLANLAQVGFRYLLGDPLGWTEEAMRYGAVWLVFLAAGATLARGEHPALDLLAAFARPAWRRAGALLALAVAAGFGLLLAVVGARFALGAAGQTSPSAELPMELVHAAVPAGGVLLLLAALCAARALLRDPLRA